MQYIMLHNTYLENKGKPQLTLATNVCHGSKGKGWGRIRHE